MLEIKLLTLMNTNLLENKIMSFGIKFFLKILKP